MILIIDNYDSFVYNLDRYVNRLGVTTEVARNDVLTPAEIIRRNYSAIIISPGPQTPNEAGYSLDIIRQCGANTPILGVCLGHQAIGQAYGGRIVRAPQPIHGQTTLIEHSGSGIFDSLPTPMQVARYHSLVIERETCPDELELIASCAPQLIMAVKHKRHPVWGVQFHPESIMTQGGFRLLANFLQLSGHTVIEPIPESDLVRPIDFHPEAKEVEPWDETPWWELP